MFGGYGLRARADEAECADISAFNVKASEYVEESFIIFSVATYVR